VTLQSSGATAANGVVTVRMSCNLSAECRGAFLVCLPLAFCQAGPTRQYAGGRLAGSDFAVPAGTTSDVPVALTDLGKQVASGPGGYMASVLVDLQDYGYVIYNDATTGSLSLATTDQPEVPPGATASCGGTVFVGPDTSCPFAENVASAYMEAGNSGSRTVTAVSPATNQAYTMQCVDGSPVACTGGTNAVVEFYS
jgi:hypothetical protein